MILESLNQSIITTEADRYRIANLEQVLHRDRDCDHDRAFSQMEHMESRICSAATES